MFCVVIDLCKKLHETIHGIFCKIRCVFSCKQPHIHTSVGEKDRLNSNEAQIPIDYTCGWAISTDEGTYTLQMLLDKADSDMYENKQLCKKRNLDSRQ